MDQTKKRASENNAKAINAILSGLVESKFVKVMQCTLEKKMWDNLQRTYEGDENLKKEKLQTHKR